MTNGDESDATSAPASAGPEPSAELEGPGIAKAKRDAPEPPPQNEPPQAAPAPPVEDKNSYRVKLPAFEGPLDLLLHLIQKHELDILDIPIGFVTEKYVEFIVLMETVNIDIASEYLVMAATLAHIKSKMLLPTPPEDQDQAAEDEEDPRAELVRRLLEYQKYKLAGEQLGSRSVLGRDVFTRGTAEAVDEGPAPLAPTSLFKLLEAFESILKRVQQTQEHQIDFERISITERINQLSDILQVTPQVEFDQLFVGQRSRADIIVTFLALLEMTRLRLTRITQDSPYAPIYVELSVREDDEGAGPAAAAGEQYVPEPAAERYVPEPAAGERYVPESSADEDYDPESSADEDYDPGSFADEDYDPESSAEESPESSAEESPESSAEESPESPADESPESSADESHVAEPAPDHAADSFAPDEEGAPNEDDDPQKSSETPEP